MTRRCRSRDIISFFLSFFLSSLFFPPPPLSFGITPFSLPLSFPCQQRAHKRTGNYQGGEKVAANFPIYTFAQSPAFRFALRPPAFISPIQTDPKQLHIYIGFILLGGIGRGGGGGWVLDCLKFALAVPLLLGRRLRRASSGVSYLEAGDCHSWVPSFFSCLSLFFSRNPPLHPCLFRTVAVLQQVCSRDETRQQRGSTLMASIPRCSRRCSPVG